MSDIWFTSDFHLGHANILKHCDRCDKEGRPFANVDEMNVYLIETHNRYVRPGDRVFNLGDMFFHPRGEQQLVAMGLAASLHGQQHLIEGNHDNVSDWCPELRSMFHWIWPRFELKVKGAGPKGTKLRVVLDHYPMRSWNARYHGAWHLYGHVHGDLGHHGPLPDVQGHTPPGERPPDPPEVPWDLPGELTMDVGVDNALRLLKEMRPFHIDEVREILERKVETGGHAIPLVPHPNPMEAP